MSTDQPQGAPAPMIDINAARFAPGHYATTNVFIAAWMLMNGGRLGEVEVQDNRPCWHVYFKESPAKALTDFYAGAATVDPVALARAVNLLLATVYAELPPGLALPSQLMEAPGPQAG